MLKVTPDKQLRACRKWKNESPTLQRRQFSMEFEPRVWSRAFYKCDFWQFIDSSLVCSYWKNVRNVSACAWFMRPILRCRNSNIHNRSLPTPQMSQTAINSISLRALISLPNLYYAPHPHLAGWWRHFPCKHRILYLFINFLIFSCKIYCDLATAI